MSDRIEIPMARNSVAIRVSEQDMAMHYGFRQLGHMEPVTPTPEQVAQHTRAVELLREIDENPYIWLGSRDDDPYVEELTTERWVADETDEQWMDRWREHRAAHPDEEPPLRSWIDRITAEMFSAASEPSPTLNMTLWRRPEPECKGAPSD